MTFTMPLIQARGTHRQVGQQIGEQLAPRIRRVVARMEEQLPAGVSWQEMLDKSRLFLAPSRQVYPQYVEELEGIAAGAGVSFERLFVSLCEELWESPLWKGGHRGCTDFAARGRATATGATLLAHTNDLAAEVEEDLAILQVQAGDAPEFLGVSVAGLGYSAGYNAAGISLTGNQVSANDVRPGVPRLLVVRAILAARRLGEAMDACLLPRRASSYNNIIADAYGEIYSLEGSATDCEPVYIDDDILAHANHYASVAMRRFEADRNDIGGSVLRHHRALRLLRENRGRLTPELFQTLLADHANYPASICKHGLESVTVFSMIIDLGELRAWIGRGRPCQTTYREYALQPWRPPEDWPR
ncbi:MAG: C45 family autoproteolytic acyltransferase/hydrolase [Anaerolineae bacterium]|jgi:isopenicillin-N N-acyltransferase-like protein